MVAHFFRRNDEPRIIYVLKIIGFGILGLIGATALALLFGYIVVWLWNWLMPELFGLKLITFWQAVGLIILARIIFGGFKHTAHDRKRDKSSSRRRVIRNHPFDRKWKYYGDYWKEEGEAAFNEYIRKKEEE
jgi:hypothetical protein